MRYSAPNTAGYIALALAVLLCIVAATAHAADLAIPKAKVIPAPLEHCLETGHEPLAGQTLHADKSCKSGMRWVFQK